MHFFFLSPHFCRPAFYLEMTVSDCWPTCVLLPRFLDIHSVCSVDCTIALSLGKPPLSPQELAWRRQHQEDAPKCDAVTRLPLLSVREYESTAITDPVLQADAPPTLPAGPDGRSVRWHDHHHASVWRSSLF